LARDTYEAGFVHPDADLGRLFPAAAEARLIVSHTRPEPMLGLLRRIDTGPRKTAALGYISRGGTLDVAGMLFANRCTWAHIVSQAARLVGAEPAAVLTAAELAAVQGRGDPHVVMHDD
jgi:hypothetical protein